MEMMMSTNDGDEKKWGEGEGETEEKKKILWNSSFDL